MHNRKSGLISDFKVSGRPFSAYAFFPQLRSKLVFWSIFHDLRLLDNGIDILSFTTKHVLSVQIIMVQ